MFKTAPFLALGISASLVAQSAVTITDGSASFAYSSYPTGTTSPAGFANFSAGGADQCYQSWWYYAVSGDAQGSALNNSGGQFTATLAPDNRSAELAWANVDSRSFAANLRNCVYSTSATSGVSAQTLTLTNNTGAALNITVFNYTDLDIDGAGTDASMQEASWPTGNQVVQDATSLNRVWVLGKGTFVAEAGPFATVRGLVMGAQPYTPSGNVVFGPGDYTGVMAWSVSIAPGASQKFETMLSIGALPASQASATTTRHCAAKPGTNGVPAWALNRPFLGASVNLAITNGFNGSAPVVFLGTSAVNVPFPPFGTVCTVPVTTISMPAFAGGVSTLPIRVPNVRSLGGQTLHLQALFADPGAAGNIAHTDGLGWTFGSFGG